MIISKDAGKKTFDKIQHPVFINSPEREHRGNLV